MVTKQKLKEVTVELEETKKKLRSLEYLPDVLCFSKEKWTIGEEKDYWVVQRIVADNRGLPKYAYKDIEKQLAETNKVMR